MNLITCKQCKEEFVPHDKTPLYPICDTCKREYIKPVRPRTKKPKKEPPLNTCDVCNTAIDDKARNAKYCTPCGRKVTKQNRRDRYLRSNKKYKPKDIQRTRETTRQWQKDNRERMREWHRRRGGKQRKYWRRLMEEYGPICKICGFELAESDDHVSGYDFHVDHIIPKAKGGSDDYDNLQLAHPACNQKKGASDD